VGGVVLPPPPPPPHAANKAERTTKTASFRTVQPLLTRLQYTRREPGAERTFGPGVPVFRAAL
jgi:hypothetical protein